jgi:hypothetical protein
MRWIVWVLLTALLLVASFQLGAAVASGVRRLIAARSRRLASDPPARLLAAAVAVLPERRREWGRAMLAELASIPGRSARWRFALSCVRATLALPPAGGWPVLALVTGMAVACAVVVGRAVGAAVPGLTVFAVTFTALVGAMAVLAVARSRRPVPSAPAVLVSVAVVASIVVTGVLLRRDPAAAGYLPAPAAVYLAVGLAGCLSIAVAPPRWLAGGRGPYLGAAAAVVFAAWSLLSHRLEPVRPPLPVAIALVVVLVVVPFAAFAVPAFVAGRAGRSLRAGLSAAVWAVAASVPLTYAVWLPEAMRRHAIDGRTLDGELIAPVGADLASALAFCLGIFPLFGLALGVAGAVLGSRRPVR